MNKAPTITLLDDYSFAGANRIAQSDGLPEKNILTALQGTAEWELRRITQGDLEIFRLSNNRTHTQCDFVCDGRVVHVLFFEVAPEMLSRSVARMDFKKVFEILVQAGFTVLQGNALTATARNPLKNVREWRTIKTKYGDKILTRLEAWYCTIGGIYAQGTLMFLAPDLAQRISKQFAVYKPYELLSVNHSIYSPELAKELKRDKSESPYLTNNFGFENRPVEIFSNGFSFV